MSKEKRFNELLGDMKRYNNLFASLSDVITIDINYYLIENLIRVENGYFSCGDYRLLGFKIGMDSNQIYLLKADKEETIDNISVLPLENYEYCDTWSDGVLVDEDILDLRFMVHQKMIELLKGLKLKKEERY